jgi:hypothetical protein
MLAPPVAKPQTKTAASSFNKLSSQRWKLAVRRFGDGTIEHTNRLPWTLANPAAPRFCRSGLGARAGKILAATMSKWPLRRI